MRRTAVLLGLLLAIGLAGSARAVSIIDTTIFWDGSLGVGGFGQKAGVAATYGQLFRVTAPETVLEGFTFFIDDRFAGPVLFEAFVMAWNGLKATGPILYQSAPMSTTNNGGLGGYETISLVTSVACKPGNRSGGCRTTSNANARSVTRSVKLTENSQYVAFLTASNVFDAYEDDVSRWGFLGANRYSGGAFVWALNGNDFSLLSTEAWSRYGLYNFSDDLAFKMSFTTNPEPHAALLFGVGVFVVARAIRRAERARAVA
ncbi:MAG: hypothetical protein V3T07_00730 [Myxococcota bacterium]